MLANFKYSATGSGFWISRDGWLLTNAHVVGSSASVDLCDATGAKLTARVVKSDPVKDLALLKVETTRTTWLPIYGGGDPPVGTPVFTAGYPKPTVQGLESKVTSGEINSHSGMRDNKDHYQCSVPIQPGNSGGALVEGTSGLCVGIVVATLRSQSGTEVSQNVNYAIKPGVARAFVETVPEAKPLLLPAAGPKALPKAAPNANPALSNQPAIQRARECAVLILVK